MDNLEMAIALLQGAINERNRLQEHDEEIAKCQTWEEECRVYEKYKRIPKKSLINDNLKMARRLILESYM